MPLIPLGIGRWFFCLVCVFAYELNVAAPRLQQTFNNLEGNFKQDMSVSTDACHSYVVFGCKHTENLMNMAAFAVPPLHFFQGTQASEINTCLAALQTPWLLAIEAWDKNFNLMLETKVRFSGQIMSLVRHVGFFFMISMCLMNELYLVQ